MCCSRCGGLMLMSDYLDMESTDELWIQAWRCVNCGRVWDAIIERHAAAPPVPVPAPTAAPLVAEAA